MEKDLQSPIRRFTSANFDESLKSHHIVIHLLRMSVSKENPSIQNLIGTSCGSQYSRESPVPWQWLLQLFACPLRCKHKPLFRLDILGFQVSLLIPLPIRSTNRFMISVIPSSPYFRDTVTEMLQFPRASSHTRKTPVLCPKGIYQRHLKAPYQKHSRIEKMAKAGEGNRPSKGNWIEVFPSCS